MEFFGDVEVFPGLPPGVHVFRIAPATPWVVLMTPPIVPYYPREGIDYRRYTGNAEVLNVSIFNWGAKKNCSIFCGIFIFLLFVLGHQRLFMSKWDAGVPPLWVLGIH